MKGRTSRAVSIGKKISNFSFYFFILFFNLGKTYVCLFPCKERMLNEIKFCATCGLLFFLMLSMATEAEASREARAKVVSKMKCLIIEKRKPREENFIIILF